MMRFLRSGAFVLLLFCAFSVCAFAGAMPDPHVIINDARFAPQTCTDLFGLSLDFDTDDNGEAHVCFVNLSGQSYQNMTFEITVPILVNDLNCGGTSYDQCGFGIDNPFLVVDFFGGVGILNGDIFSVDVEGFPPDSHFHGDANQLTPEPTSFLLLGSGLAALVAKGWKRII
jgi:hypothetical protein